MKTSKTKDGAKLQIWQRNAVVGAISLFVCMAVYLNWNYEQEAGKTLGKAAMVGSETSDPLVNAGKTDGTGELVSNKADPTEKVDATSNDYFANARVNRQLARDSALSLLRDAAAGDAVDQTLKDEANLTIQTMADYTVDEANIENLVVAKGYIDCVAFIGEDSVSLAVASTDGAITDADTARIVDVVQQGTDFTASQIKIVSVD